MLLSSGATKKASVPRLLMFPLAAKTTYLAKCFFSTASKGARKLAEVKIEIIEFLAEIGVPVH